MRWCQVGGYVTVSAASALDCRAAMLLVASIHLCDSPLRAQEYSTPNAAGSFGFATVFGAGHMVRDSCATQSPKAEQCVNRVGRFSPQVPQTQPRKALALFGKISGTVIAKRWHCSVKYLALLSGAFSVPQTATSTTKAGASLRAHRLVRVQSAAWLSAGSVPLSICPPLHRAAVTTQPVPVSVAVGSPVVLSVECAGGALPYLYQW